MKRTYEEYQEKLKSLFLLTGIPVAIVTDPNKFEILCPRMESEPDINKHGLFLQKLINKYHLPLYTPLIKSIYLSSFYCILRVEEDVFVQLGPVASHDINFALYLPYMRKKYDTTKISHHFQILQSSPRITLNYFYHYVIHATDYLCDRQITIQDMVIEQELAYYHEKPEDSIFDHTFLSIHDLSLDNEIFQVIESGNLKRLKELQDQNSLSSLFYYQDQSIYFLKVSFLFYGGIYCHYAALGGANEDGIKKCFDYYLNQMSKCTDSSTFWDLLPLFSESLCQLVHDSHRETRHTGAIKKAIDYIDQNIYCQISIEDLEKVTQISRRTLLRHFKEHLNTTPSEYIQNAKLEEAAYLLKESDLTIIEISNMLTYSSQSHFTRAFQKKYGTTPYQYRLTHA